MKTNLPAWVGVGAWGIYRTSGLDLPNQLSDPKAISTSR